MQCIHYKLYISIKRKAGWYKNMRGSGEQAICWGSACLTCFQDFCRYSQRAHSTRAQTWTPWNTRALPFLWAVTEGRAPRLPFWIYLIPTHLTYLPFLDSSAGLQLEAQDSMECGKWKSPGQREVFKGRTADMERRQKTSLNNWSTSCLRCVCN